MGWVALFLAHGIKVVVSDPADGAEDALKQYLEQARSYLREHGNYDELVANYEFVRDIIPQLPMVDFVQEVRSRTSLPFPITERQREREK